MATIKTVSTHHSFDFIIAHLPYFRQINKRDHGSLLSEYTLVHMWSCLTLGQGQCCLKQGHIVYSDWQSLSRLRSFTCCVPMKQKTRNSSLAFPPVFHMERGLADQTALQERTTPVAKALQFCHCTVIIVPRVEETRHSLLSYLTCRFINEGYRCRNCR